MTTYTNPHQLPIIESTDKIAATGDGLREDLNALSTATNTAITNEGIRAENTAKWPKGNFPYTDAYAALTDGLWALPTTATVDAVSNMPSGAGPGIFESRRVGSTATIQTYREYAGQGRIWEGTAGPSGAVVPWRRIDAGAVPASASPDQARPSSGLKTVPLAMTLGTSDQNAPTTGTARLPVDFDAPITRWRLRIANRNPRTGNVRGTADFTGLWYGAHAGNGQFAAGQNININPAFTIPADGTAWASPWFTQTLGMGYLLSFGYTAAAAPFQLVGGSWQSAASADAGAEAPALSLSGVAPFDIWVEAETPAMTPVVAVLGDSLSAGVGATLPVHDSALSQHMRTINGLPVHYAASGDTLAGWNDPAAYKWTRWQGLDRPDAVILAMGSNDIFGGATLADAQSRHATVVASLKEKVSARIYGATIMPRTSVTGAAETTRRDYNTWLSGLPNDTRDLFGFAASISGDDETITPAYDADGVHLNTAGYAQNAGTLVRPLTTDQAYVGPAGPAGAGVPAGGAAFQVVRRNAANTTTEWATPNKDMVGLGNVDNTADADKPVSTAQAAELVKKISKGETGTYNVYVSPTGSDTNDGLTAGAPFATFQKAFDYLATQGPLLQGTWYVNAAAGTYPISTAQQTLTTRSVNRVIVRGPDVAGHPNVPTAIIDGAGGAAYKHGLSASGVGVRVEFRDLKFVNFTAGDGDNSRIGCLGESESDVYFNNIHATGATWTGIYAFNTVRARIAGGIFTGCRAGIVANCTQATVTDSIIRTSTETGIYWSRGSQGHVDYVTFEDNAIGLRVAENSRVDTVGNNFKRNNYGIRAQTGGLYGEGGAPNIFNAGTADAQIFADIEHSALAGNSVELETSQQYIRVAYDRTTRTHTGTTAITTLATPYTIPAERLTGTGKQARIHVLGVFTTATAGTIMTVSIGGMDVAFTVPAAASNVAFEIDLTLMEVAGGYRAIGKLSQGLNATRFATATSGFTSTSAQAVVIKATLANSGDSIAIYRTDVYIMG